MVNVWAERMKKSHESISCKSQSECESTGKTETLRHKENNILHIQEQKSVKVESETLASEYLESAAPAAESPEVKKTASISLGKSAVLVQANVSFSDVTLATPTNGNVPQSNLALKVFSFYGALFNQLFLGR